MKKNQLIRDAAKASGVKQWEIAKKLNVGEWTLSRWMREELNWEKTLEIMDTIESIKEEHMREMQG